MNPIKIWNKWNRFISILSTKYFTTKDGMQTAIKKPNASTETINSELFVKRVGFKSIQIDESIAFDKKKKKSQY